MPGSSPTPNRAEIEFDIDLTPPGSPAPDAPVRVTRRLGRWMIERGDFRAEWEPASRRGWIRQTANPYSIDAVLRIVHTLVLARQGGFLHALRQRHPQRQSVPVRRRFRGRKDDHLPARSARRHALDRRNLLRPQAGLTATLPSELPSPVNSPSSGKMFPRPSPLSISSPRARRIASTPSRPAKLLDPSLPTFSFSPKMRNWCNPFFVPPLIS